MVLGKGGKGRQEAARGADSELLRVIIEMGARMVGDSGTPPGIGNGCQQLGDEFCCLEH